jgi:predicted transcriptional regulator
MGLRQTEAKETVSKLERQHIKREKIFVNSSSDKGMCREHKKLNPQRINIPMKKRALELNREFSKKWYKGTVNV